LPEGPGSQQHSQDDPDTVVDKRRTYLGSLVTSDEVITLFSEEDGQLTGFLIAPSALNPAPPVYDPGGLACDIDDFVVTLPAK
jgi:hypothetical protein